MNTNNINLTLNVGITDEDIDDIMSTALEGGINYWCDKVTILGDSYGKDYASEVISAGGILQLHDNEEEKQYELTKEKFLTGVEMYIKNYGLSLEHNPKTKTLMIDTCNIDAEIADSIVQLAVFNELIYG